MNEVDKLKQRAITRQNELEAHRHDKKLREENDTTINEAKDRKMTDFFCIECELDFNSIGNKVVQVDWNNGKNIAFYVGYCDEGHQSQRRITDMVNDPYYNNSIIVRRQRIDGANDMLTPDDFGFRTLYGDPYNKD